MAKPQLFAPPKYSVHLYMSICTAVAVSFYCAQTRPNTLYPVPVRITNLDSNVHTSSKVSLNPGETGGGSLPQARGLHRTGRGGVGRRVILSIPKLPATR